ncbi:MAG TPA: type II toxin-antitoxin system RelE/ParE family toxin, partial [Verrucomicrobiae bacterium]
MNYAVIRGDQFMEDVYWRARWYTRKAGTDVAQKFEAAVDETLLRIGRNPTIGHVAPFSHPDLQKLRSLTVVSSFGQIRIFYRMEGSTVYVFR